MCVSVTVPSLKTTSQDNNYSLCHKNYFNEKYTFSFNLSYIWYSLWLEYFIHYTVDLFSFTRSGSLIMHDVLLKKVVLISTVASFSLSGCGAGEGISGIFTTTSNLSSYVDSFRGHAGQYNPTSKVLLAYRLEPLTNNTVIENCDYSGHYIQNRYSDTLLGLEFAGKEFFNCKYTKDGPSANGISAINNNNFNYSTNEGRVVYNYQNYTEKFDFKVNDFGVEIGKNEAESITQAPNIDTIYKTDGVYLLRLYSPEGASSYGKEGTYNVYVDWETGESNISRRVDADLTSLSYLKLYTIEDDAAPNMIEWSMLDISSELNYRPGEALAYRVKNTINADQVISYKDCQAEYRNRTLEPFEIVEQEPYPSKGVMTIENVTDNITVKMKAISSQIVELEIDQNSNGVVDNVQRISWDELLNLPPC